MSHEHSTATYETIINAVGDGVYQLDTEGRFVQVNDVVVEETGYSRAELLGSDISIVLDGIDITKSLQALRELAHNEEQDVAVLEVTIYTASGETVPVENRISLLEGENGIEGTVGVVRDISERRRRERLLERQRTDLERLDRINSAIRGINQVLLTATTREEIEQTVVTLLGELEAYSFVWIGDVNTSTGTVDPNASGGFGEGFLDAIHPVLADHAGDRGEDGTAAEYVVDAAESRVIDDIGTAEAAAPWRRQALTRGFLSASTVPIQYENAVYGVLTIYAHRTSAFPPQEQAVLEELGELIGHAINSLDRREALLTDRVVALETRTPLYSGSEARTLDGSLAIDRTIPLGESSALVYVSTAELSPEAALEHVEALPSVTSVRELAGDDSAIRFEVSFDRRPVTAVLASQGGHVQEATIEDGDLWAEAWYPAGTDTRRVLGAVRSAFPATSLVSKRFIEREIADPDPLWDGIETDLTDRQRTSLELSYYGGFYDWPRECSAGELAARLEISSPTFQQHRRAAERKVFAHLFQRLNEARPR